ncbi:TetR/AcrR family transcriptional regulator [Pseudomonas sp. RC10]|uniref:TetR/AcrR family transcriptional regulator n=1 Tax=Pseudomonas bambusae TaxID=3139142 RepID=UPI0031386455
MTASRLYREHGIEGIGIQKLSKTVGLTHGGFYKQFPDGKGQLMAEAVALMFDEYHDLLSRPTTLESVIDRYLSAEHRNSVQGGCPVPILSPDVSRNKNSLGNVYDHGIKRMLKLLMSKPDDRQNTMDEERAMQLLASMAGALMIAKAVNDETLSQRFLAATRHLWGLE